MEIYELFPENTLGKTINNLISISPAFDFEHQYLPNNLYSDINLFVRKNNLEKCVVSQAEVYLRDKNAVLPYIILISNNSLGIIQDRKIKGSPDLIMEIFFSNKKHDL